MALHFSDGFVAGRIPRLPWQGADEAEEIALTHTSWRCGVGGGADAFLKAINHENARAKEQALSLGPSFELTCFGLGPGSVMNTIRSATFCNAVAGLTTLSVSATFGEARGNQQVRWKAVSEATTKLQHLKLSCTTPTAFKQKSFASERVGMQSLRHSSTDISQSSRLSKLVAKKPPFKASSRPPGGWDSSDDTRSDFERCALKSVFMAEFDLEHWIVTCYPMKAALRLCRYVYRLQQFNMTLHRMSIHACTCPMTRSTRGLHHCLEFSAAYRIGDDHTMSPAQLDRVAQPLAIEMDGGVWNFGECGMRPGGSDDDGI